MVTTVVMMVVMMVMMVVMVMVMVVVMVMAHWCLEATLVPWCYPGVGLTVNEDICSSWTQCSVYAALSSSFEQSVFNRVLLDSS